MSLSEKFKPNIILWLALLAGQLMIAVIFIFIVGNKEGGMTIPYKGFAGLMPSICLAVTASATILSNFLYKRKQANIPLTASLDDKLTHYRESFVLRAAPLEAANLLSLIFMFLENNLAYFTIVIVGVLLFLQTRPDEGEFRRGYGE